MNSENLSLEEIREKTREQLGFSPEDDLSYIDEEYITGPFVGMPEDMTNMPTVVYGNRVSYGSNGGGPTYLISSGNSDDPNDWDTSENACGQARKWMSQAYWHHDNTGTYCGGSEQPAYRRVSRFTYSG